MKKIFISFTLLFMFFTNINCVHAEDFLSAMQAFSQNVANSTLKSLNLEIAQKAAGSNYDIEFYVDKHGNFSNFKIIKSTNNKEVDEHIINTVKLQTHKFPLPSQMSSYEKPVKLNIRGKFKQLNEDEWNEYTNKIQAEIFKDSNAITSLVQEAQSKVGNGAYVIFIDKNGIFYNVIVSKSTGHPNIDKGIIDLIKSKSGIIPLPESCKMEVQSFTLNVQFEKSN